MLFQSVNLVGHLDVDANLALSQHLAGHGNDAARRAALLERVGLRSRSDATPSRLSGGELARAGLALALVNDPAVLLCDEPTGELDEGSAERVLELLADRAREGGAVLVVTHNPSVAAAADRVIRLRDGEVVAMTPARPAPRRRSHLRHRHQQPGRPAGDRLRGAARRQGRADGPVGLRQVDAPPPDGRTR